ncbi:MAG: type II secretion system minor pseudopilin GspI [Gammaproteobacteria bacterium]
MHSEKQTSRTKGFTLLEVIVALAVVALGLIAAFNGVIQITSGAAYMRERTLANWVAMNELTRIRVSGVFPEVSESDGDVEFGLATYRWRANVSETGVDELRRIDMEIAYVDSPDEIIATATGFVSPRPPALTSPRNWGTASPNNRSQDSDADTSPPDESTNPGNGDNGDEEE